MQNPDDTDSLPLYFPRATLEHAAPILSPLDRAPLAHHTDNADPNRNGAPKQKRRTRHAIRRGGLAQDLIHYQYLEMRDVGDFFFVPVPSGVTVHAMQCHVSLVCRQMSEVLNHNRNGVAYGVVVCLKSRAEPGNNSVRVTRVS